MCVVRVLSRHVAGRCQRTRFLAFVTFHFVVLCGLCDAILGMGLPSYGNVYWSKLIN